MPGDKVLVLPCRERHRKRTKTHVEMSDVCRGVISLVGSRVLDWCNSSCNSMTTNGFALGLANGAQLSVTQGLGEIFRLRLSLGFSLRTSNEIKRRRWRTGFHRLKEKTLQMLESESFVGKPSVLPFLPGPSITNGTSLASFWLSAAALSLMESVYILVQRSPVFSVDRAKPTMLMRCRDDHSNENYCDQEYSEGARWCTVTDHLVQVCDVIKSFKRMVIVISDIIDYLTLTGTSLLHSIQSVSCCYGSGVTGFNSSSCLVSHLMPLGFPVSFDQDILCCRQINSKDIVTLSCGNAVQLNNKYEDTGWTEANEVLQFSVPTGSTDYQDFPDDVLRPVGKDIDQPSFKLPTSQQSFVNSMIMPFLDDCHNPVELVSAHNQGIQQLNAAQLLHNGIPPMNGIKVSEAGNDFKPVPLPNRSGMVFRSKQYPLVNSLLTLSHINHYFVKQRREIRLNQYLSKLVLHHQHQDGSNTTCLEKSTIDEDDLSELRTTKGYNADLPSFNLEQSVAGKLPMASDSGNVTPKPLGAQLDALYNTKLEHELQNSCKEVRQMGNAKATLYQHKVELSKAANRHLPKRGCILSGRMQYPLTSSLLSHPHMDHYFVKERTEIRPSHYLAKLVLRHQYLNRDDVNEDTTAVTAAQQSQAAVLAADSAVEKDGAVTERKHFPMNLNKTGFVVFSSDLTRFTGNMKYPLSSIKATAVKLGKGGNGFVFAIFYNGKEYAVKKTVYRPNEIRVHSQLAYPNLVNLDAVLIGEEHEKHKGKFYAFCFMTKCDMDFRSVISTKEHGCLKHLKLQLSDQHDAWQLVMVNVKYVLRAVLKALDYMHKQGLVHRDVKASNILLKMQCQCSQPLMCACPQKYLVKLGDFDSSTTVPGHGLKIEPHQMIRYASVLPLGTMGYRAPEVSMHLVIAGPYEVLYTTAVDIWSFGCLLLNMLIGKCGPLKQRGEASLLLSTQNQPYAEPLYNQIIKIKELQKYYGDMPEMVDLVRKCLQVEVHCRPSAKQLLQLDILQCI